METTGRVADGQMLIEYNNSLTLQLFAFTIHCSPTVCLPSVCGTNTSPDITSTWCASSFVGTELHILCTLRTTCI